MSRVDDPQRPPSATVETADSPILSAERLKAFIDAVVAIAMTLLILPLMESVIALGHEGKGVQEYLAEDGMQLFSFALSFLLIATFWMTHHRIFDRVESTTNAMVWTQVAWMFTIVWLPVPTAMLGSMDTSTVQKLLYIGSLLLTSLLLLVTRLYLRAHPQLHSIPPQALGRGIRVEIVLCTLFAVALNVAILVPEIGYFAMFLMLLSAPTQLLLDRRRRGTRGAAAAD